MTNRLALSGTVCRAPFERSVHQEFRIASSCLSIVLCKRKPAFTGRRGAKCPLLLADTKTEAITHSITVGSRITVQGFISCHKAKNGLSKMVLHAEQIELIDSGD